MLGVTTFVTTDVAAIPLLWTVPLALYLFTFVNAFSARPLVPERLARATMTVLTLPLVLLALTALSNPAWVLLVPGGGVVLHTDRTFFGVLRVVLDEERSVHRLMHGATMHGEESLRPELRGESISYYHRTGPVGQAIDALSDRLRRVAVMGLGAGSLAAFAQPGQQWTFFEIDPAVERIARDRRYFSCLDTCGDQCEVVGDARLRLEAMEGTRFDAMVIDAFSSDAIPTHLMTRQAFELYLNRLAEDGVLALHVSNRHMRLEPLLGAIARELGLVALRQFDVRGPGDLARSSDWLLMAPIDRRLRADGGGRELAAGRGRHDAVWTDDYSNLLSVLERPRFALP
jgi:spermidine synthase